MKQIPGELHDDIERLKSKHAASGWQDICIGAPDFSNLPVPSLFVYATLPRGERVSCIVAQDGTALKTIDAFLSKRNSN